MATFTVTWTIDIDADNPREAAEQALTIQRDAGSDAVVFEVHEELNDSESSRVQIIDLSKEG